MRRSYGHKMWAIVKIQSHVRTMIARRRYRRMRKDALAHHEALRLRSQEEQRLHHQGNTRAKEIAEQNYRVSGFYNVKYTRVNSKIILPSAIYNT